MENKIKRGLPMVVFYNDDARENFFKQQNLSAEEKEVLFHNAVRKAAQKMSAQDIIDWSCRWSQ